MFAGLALLALLPSGGVRGEDFRVDNRVYAAAAPQPASQSTTIFQGASVYDFMTEPHEVIVLDARDATDLRFTLLDVRRRVRTEMSSTDLASFSQRLKQWGENHRDPLVKFSAAPQFTWQFDQARGELTAESTSMTYRLRTRPAESPEMARQYAEFSDWLCRLNALLNPGSRLPFPRLHVNQQIAQRRILPREVVLTISSTAGGQVRLSTIRSEHEWSRPLSAADLERVRQARGWQEEFQLVRFDEYRKPAAR